MSSSLNITGLVSDIDWQELASEISSSKKTAATQPYEHKKTAQQEKLSAWQSFNTTLSTITDYISSNELNDDDGYESYAAALTSSDSSITASDILSVSIGTGTLSAGTYTIEVTQLAQAEKISSDVVASSSESLNKTGDIVINGKTISVSSSDTLTTIAKKINSADAGVTASVLSVDSGNYLTLQSSSQGSTSISLAVSGTSNLLQDLGLSEQVLANASGSDALSDTFTDGTTAIGTLNTALTQSGDIQIKGTTVSIDFTTDSLQTIADRINAAGITDVTASVEVVDGKYQLKLTNVTSGELVDSNNVLHAIGVLGETAKNVIQEGMEAKLKIDGYDMTSSSNTITGAIPGITLKLTETNEGKPVTLEITKDNSGLSSTLDTLVSNINEALSYIKDQNTYSSDEDSTSKPLFADSSLSSIKRNISNVLLDAVELKTDNATYTTAASIGISFKSDGSLSFDADTFSAALSDNPDEVIAAVKALSSELYDKLNVYVDTTTGTIKSIEDSINDNIDRIDKQLERIEARCDAEAERLQRQFSALEVLISQSKTTTDWLAAQVDANNNSD